MKTLSICEHESVSVGPDLTDKGLTIAEVEALDRAQKRMGASAFSWSSRHKIKASQFVGIIATSSVRLEILPKIERSKTMQTRGALTKMIGASLSIPVYDGEITSLDTQDQDLLEIVILVFARRLMNQVRKGLTRNYNRQHDDLARLRGKLDVTRQFTKYASMPQILACEFDEFTADNPLNRLLACASSLLMRKTKVDRTRRLLAEIDAHFTDVMPVTSEQALAEKIEFDRKNERWIACERLARLLLQSFYQTVHSGKRAGVALLFDMNKLFEAYVTKIAQKALRPLGYAVLSQKPQRALVRDETGQKAFITKPDIYLKRNEQIIIVDTKWKPLDFSKKNYGVSQADAYQMHGYAKVYDAISVLLLYPQMDDQLGEIENWFFENSRSRLRLATINILDEEAMTEFFRDFVSAPAL